MSETEKVFSNLIKDTREKALDSYRTALKKKIEEMKKEIPRLPYFQVADRMTWNAALDKIKDELIDSTTI